MKKVLNILLVTSFAASGYAALGDVVASFPAPADFPLALARATNDSYMWVFCNTSPYNVYRISASTGSVYESFVLASGTYTRGLTYEVGGYLYYGNYSTDYIYKVSYASPSSVISSYPAGGDMHGGLALQATGDGGSGGTDIFWADDSPTTVTRLNRTTGSFVSSFSVLGCGDIAYDWRNEIVWGGTSSPGIIYGYSTSGSLITSFAAPSSYPFAMTYYGQYLWVGTTEGSIPHHIFQIHCPVLNVNVTPSSLGKVKALYK